MRRRSLLAGAAGAAIVTAARAQNFPAKPLRLIVPFTPGGMVFLRCNGDHHCLALIGGLPAEGEVKRTLHHIAFELATLDEVFRARDHLQKYGAKIVFEGRRRAGCQVSVEFLDPDGHHLELYWGVDQIGYDGRSRPEEEWRQTMSLEDAVRIAPPGQDTTLHDKTLSDRIGGGTDRA